MKEVRFLGLGKGLFFMKRKVRRIDEIVTRFATLGMLSALGFVLMAFAKFPYPFAPWLEVELSEIVTIIAYALYGLPGGIIVAVLKTVLKLLAVGTSSNYLGEVTALLASLMFIIGLAVTSHLKLFKKGLGFRIVSYSVIAVFVAIMMTLLNAIVITPSYLTIFANPPHLSTCFDKDVLMKVYNKLMGANSTVNDPWLYIGAVSIIYLPFNLMKAAACFLLYEILFNRLIFVFMRRSTFFKKYFVGDIFTKKEEEDNPDVVVKEKQPQE